MLQTITERVPFESHYATAALLGFDAEMYNYDICPLNIFDKRLSFTVYTQKDLGIFVVSFKGSQDTYTDVIADFNNVQRYSRMNTAVSGQGSGSVAEGSLKQTGVAAAVFRHVGEMSRIGLNVGDVRRCAALSSIANAAFLPIQNPAKRK
ncbi:MAG: hypothetical protein GY822_01260 [Deltaproteobacteria bacterium]|nr:hypothetical protein [Deltaproteobacteria bacterium]